MSLTILFHIGDMIVSLGPDWKHLNQSRTTVEGVDFMMKMIAFREML